MSRAQVEIHELLAHQYNLHVAGRFMPHATIKGFFRSDAAVETMIERLDATLAGRQSFPVYNRGIIELSPTGFGLNVHQTPDGQRNEALQDLHQRVLDALLPLVHSDCNFTPGEGLGERFFAHLTLAMADIPPQFYAEIVQFTRALEPIGPASFPATTIQLFAFTSQQWTGAWGTDFAWQLLHSWTLAGASATGA